MSMWALRRASVLLRSRGYSLGTTRGARVNLRKITCVEDETRTFESSQRTYDELFPSKTLKTLSNSLLLVPFLSKSLLSRSSGLNFVVCKVCGQEPIFGHHCNMQGFPLMGRQCIHSGTFLKFNDKVVEPLQYSENSPAVNSAVNAMKRKKLKGKRAVVRWLKFFRWNKKKEYQRMTAEEKILYKLRKARKKEERLVEALKKIEPAESSETTHDPEILTPEEHFYFMKMGLKCKNYVPVGRRGIYQGVILNMHLHWKKHQTLKVVVKTFSPEEVKEIAAELARLTGGIVLDIHEDNTIIMYRGKNYSQPPTEIMSPRVTLSRKKALDKSKYLDALRAVRRYIPRLEQELQLLQAQLRSEGENKTNAVEGIQQGDIDNTIESADISNFQLDSSDKLKEIMGGNIGSPGDDTDIDTELDLEVENLSDIFETDSETENEVKKEQPLYLDKFDNFPALNDGESYDFEEHLQQISLNSKNSKSLDTNVHSPKFDEVDLIFLRAASRLKKTRK
ncbi:hypothetical protein L6164_002423 [Bauhinia variegata]|uniref:Uncharacterized protein n=1 Tax=Bauhinia variegata TaxID=167791 RepID=A0ACB9PYQ3_BAUVA|nr:hypothetical protein L6164_002423 [Bauhinia variegata]